MMRQVCRFGAGLFLFGAAILAPGQPLSTSDPDATDRVIRPPNRQATFRPEVAQVEPVRLVSATDRGVEIELAIPDYDLVASAGGKLVDVPGLDRLAAPGEPDLPGAIVLVGVPQTGAVRLEVTPGRTETVAGVDLRPAPGFGPAAPQFEGTEGTWPTAPARIDEIVTIRGVRVARLRMNPVRYDRSRRELTIHRDLRVKVEFDALPVERVSTDGFDDLFESLLANGSQARAWKLDPPGEGDTFNFFLSADVWCKVRTETTGVCRITKADLTTTGFDLAAVNPSTFRLYSIGDYRVNEEYPDTMVEVAIYVAGEDDGSFDQDDYIAFYAEAPSWWTDDGLANDSVYWRNNEFTDYRHWWLTWGDAPGRRMATVSGAGAQSPVSTAEHRLRREPERLCPARSGLLWLWDYFYKQPGLQSIQFRLPLGLPNPVELERLTLRFYARTSVNAVRVYLNGVELDSFQFGGSPQYPRPRDAVMTEIPPGLIAGLDDSLTIELYGDQEMEVWSDFLEAKYTERLAVSEASPLLMFSQPGGGVCEFEISGGDADLLLLDVTNRWAPRRVVDAAAANGSRRVRLELDRPARLLAARTSALRRPVSLERRRPGWLKSWQEEVDYCIICPDEFYPVARLLARYRTDNIAGIENARAEAVKLSDIYDEYGFGQEEPGPIRRFLRAKAPQYVLLAGDGTYDYRNKLDLDQPPMVPAYEVGYDIDPEVYGQQAKALDAWYADLDGTGGPDLVLGRVTPRSATELRQFLEKIRRYESQPFGIWARRLLLLADDEFEGSPDRPDPIGFSHIVSCEGIEQFGRDLLDPVKVYLTEYDLTAINDKAGARAELLTRLNEGALLWFFFGHGAGFQLCHERALNIDGVGAVDNGNRSPVAFFGSCGVGRFEDTRYEAIAEELVRQPSGCIATMGATKATQPGANDYFAKLFIGELIAFPQMPVGKAFFRAWTTANPNYHFFGDPCAVIRFAPGGLEPEVDPFEFRPGGVVHVTDSVPMARGLYGITVHEEDRLRRYGSTQGETTYSLPGYQIHAAVGSFDHGRVRASFIVPKLDYPDTMVVPNGSYIRVDSSAWVSLICWDGARGYGSWIEGMSLGEPLVTSDSAPPSVALYADGIRLSETDTTRVPNSFRLAGVLEDPSGILLARVPDYGLALYLGASVGERVDLSGSFNYDKNSITRGRFSWPIDVGQRQDSLTLIVSDNLRNRCFCTYRLTTDLVASLRLDSCLVYPNPVSGPAYFTFRLSRAAYVSAKVYTIAGRLVRQLPERLANFGYNQIEWDGRDKAGRELANGVYLYKLDARSAESTGSVSYSTTHRDKLLVRR